ncbi:DUF2281 domain-containing protein [Hymenobacter sp.]|jgi:hypothetical protein|uniref:DUF2281 domain-containing protein n=1 Tax=Hymenobacter sp. TaxID=1898978 RepID=UPI002ED8E47D
MNTSALHKAIDELPPPLQDMVAVYVAGLQQQQQVRISAASLSRAEIQANRQAGLGELQGNVWMADDFNAPLADFAEY